MNMLAAVLAGLMATIVFTMVLFMAPRMGMPKMDIVGMLSTMLGKANLPLGWALHLMMGVAFGLIYAFLWSKGIGAATWQWGLAFGAAHWLIVGLVMGMIPLVHLGIRRGVAKAPGYWMTNNGGMLAFGGGLMGHLIFGVVTALVYSLV